jgi:hypothetical protein
MRRGRLVCGLTVLVLAGCVNAPAPKGNYSQFRTEDPHSILVVPVTNRSVDVNAPDYFLSTITPPLAERGYYVFPVNMVKSVMADDGLSDANLVHAGDPHRLGELFGADAVMYISIERWDAQYVLLSTSVTVSLNYALKSTHTGNVLWTNHQTVVYTPQNNGSQSSEFVPEAAETYRANFPDVPLGVQANQQAINLKGTGLPAGPYNAQFGKDSADF